MADSAFRSLHEIAAAVDRMEIPVKRDDNPLYGSWHLARRTLSNFSWDIFTAHCLLFYARQNGATAPPALSSSGLATGVLPQTQATSLHTAFRGCPPYNPPVSGHEVPAGHFFGPGVSEATAEHTRRRFITRRMTDEMARTLKGILDELAETFNALMGHYWVVTHVRLYERRPEAVPADYEWHLDGWPIGLKKLYIYPEGASVKDGTTQIRLSDGSTTFVDGGPGTWALFENSVVVHRALPSEHKWRPAIEVSIAPSLAMTDTTPRHMGIVGNYPWYPIDFADLDHPAIQRNFKRSALEYRCLMRTMGLARAIQFQDTSLGVDAFHVPAPLGPRLAAPTTAKPVASNHGPTSARLQSAETNATSSLKVFIFNIEHYVSFEQESQNYLVRLPVIHCGLDLKVHDHVHQRTLRACGREEAEAEAIRAVQEFSPDVVLYFQCWKDEDLSPACLKRIRALRIPVIGFIWDSNLVPRHNEIWLFENVDYLVIIDSINAYVRWKTLARVMSEPKQVLFGGGLYYVDPAESATVAKKHDVTFVGSAEGERAELIQYLRSELAKRSIDFVKAGGLVNDDTSAAGSERRWLSPEEYNQAIRQSRICLSSQSVTSRAQIKGKIFEIMARGTLCLAEASSENLRLFPPEVLPTYKDKEDCLAKLEYFLAHPAARQQIEKNAMLWVQEHFDCKKFYRQLLTHAVHRTGQLPSLRALEAEFDLTWSNRNLMLPLLANLVTKLVQHIDNVRVQAQTV